MNISVCMKQKQQSPDGRNLFGGGAPILMKNAGIDVVLIDFRSAVDVLSLFVLFLSVFSHIFHCVFRPCGFICH